MGFYTKIRVDQSWGAGQQGKETLPLAGELQAARKSLRVHSVGLFRGPRVRFRGFHENTTYLKLHDTGPGKIRIMRDYLYLMHGLKNRNLDEGIRNALYGVVPI